MWKEFVSNLLPMCQFNQPVSEKLLLEVEKELGISFPDQLKALLLETDGVKEEYGIDLLWSLKRIREDNLRFRNCPDFREIYMSLDSLLFFADSGNGDQFAFPIVNRSSCRDDIYVWNHEDDSRVWVAPSLKQFLMWWSDGTIKV